MPGSATTVRCPHCGAENPRSLLITLCQQCKGSLAAPAAAPRPTPSLPPTAPGPVRPARPPKPPRLPEPAPVVRQPVQPPRPMPQPQYPPPTPVTPQRPTDYGPPARAHRESPLVGIGILLFAMAALGVGMAVVMSISK